MIQRSLAWPLLTVLAIALSAALAYLPVYPVRLEVRENVVGAKGDRIRRPLKFGSLINHLDNLQYERPNENRRLWLALDIGMCVGAAVLLVLTVDRISRGPRRS